MVEQNDKKITIVINGKERDVHHRYASSDNENIIDTNDWYVEHQVKHPRFRDHRLRRSYFKKNTQKKSSRFPKKRNNTVIKQVWVSALTALGIGATFGFLMLALFTGEESVLDNAQGKEAQVNEVASLPVEEETLELAISLIQGGAFETIESANQAKEHFINGGYAAVVDETEQPYRLYIGLGTNKAHLQPLISAYEADGEDTYVKDLSVIPREEITEEEIQTLIEGKHLLLAFMMDIKRLFNEQAIEDHDTLSEKLFEWKAELEHKEDVNQKQIDFAHTLQQTDGAIQAYVDEKRREHLWEAEQFILEAFLLYKKIIS